MSPQPPHRHLSARRGSTSALDPYAVHADINENPNRTSSSKLTIVRVLPQQPPILNTPLTLNDPPSSFTSATRRRRLGSSGPHSSPTPDSPPPGRLSFAFSSFGPAYDGHSSDRPGSPNSPPRLRPSSPRLSASGGSTSSIGKARLTPNELVDLARQATNPRTLAQIAHTPGPSSPAPLSASSGYSAGASPVLRSHSAHLPSVSNSTVPATFTPLPDDIFLPFIDRPSEVAHVISIPPDAKLFALLSQALPKTYTGEAGDLSKDSDAVHLPRDPSLWTYAHLIHHLTQVDRDVAPDPIWTFAARKCILSHSELIWERVKGALGIPPELDINYDFTRKRFHRSASQERRDARMRKLRMELREGAPKHRVGQAGVADNESAIEDDDEYDESESNTDLSEDEGRGATGHWSDWDATIDSPAYPRGGSRVASVGPSSPDLRRDSVHDVGGVLIGSFNNPSNIGISMERPSPHLGATRVDSEDEDFISIEALLAPSPETTGAFNSNLPPPLSHATSALLSTGVAADTPAAEGVGLGDIAEGEEDEEEDLANISGDALENVGGEPKPEDEHITPSQIQGLRIMTCPVHAAGAYGVGGQYHHPHSLPTATPPHAASPLPISAAVGDDRTEASTLAWALASNQLATASAPGHLMAAPVGERTHSRTSSFSSVTGISIGPFSRSESTGNLAALMAAAQNQHHNSGSDAGDSAGYTSDWSVGATVAGSPSIGGPPQVEIVGDRAPGQPLFVSNFARLTGCPTLKGTGSPRPKPSRFKLKRTGSTGSGVNSVPSSNFLGSIGRKLVSTNDSEVSLKPRTHSHGRVRSES